MTVEAFEARLEELGVSQVLAESAQAFLNVLPPGATLTSDVWNVASWRTTPGRVRNMNLDLSCFTNLLVRDALKLFILHRRASRMGGTSNRGFTAGSADLYYRAVKGLDAVMPKGSRRRPTTADFQLAEQYLTQHYSRGVAPRYTHALQIFSRFLTVHLGTRTSYRSGLQRRFEHGVWGTDKGRQAKLPSTAVLCGVLRLAARRDLSLRDRLFVMAIVILIPTGFRINELLTLRADCLVTDEGTTSLAYLAEKSGRSGRKQIKQEFVPVLLEALQSIREITEPGREAARMFATRTGWGRYDWSAILDEPTVATYFLGRLLHQWTVNPRNSLVGAGQGIWYQRQRRWIDIRAEISVSGGNICATATRLRMNRATVVRLRDAQHALESGEPVLNAFGQVKKNWDTDSRLVSMGMLSRELNLLLSPVRRKELSPLLYAAQALQLRGEVFPEPAFDIELERRYLRTLSPIRQTSAGLALVRPEEALFVVEDHTLTEYAVKSGVPVPVTAGMLTRWLCGDKRDSHDNSVFARHGIVDPATGQVARLTSHQVRHWLDTQLAANNYTQLQRALIMGRNPSQNHVYDQTTSEERAQRARDAVRDGEAIGHVARAYRRIADESSAQAELYLQGAMRRYSTMPHGLCLRNLRVERCPNNLSCFRATASQGDGKRGPCQDLLVMKGDPVVTRHLQDLERREELMLTVIPTTSPQYQAAVETLDNIRHVQAELHTGSA